MTQTEAKVETALLEKSENENGNTPAVLHTEAEVEPTMEEKIVHQVEFYFGDANLPRDRFIKLESAKHNGWFPADLLLKFNMLTRITSSLPQKERLKKILEALQGSVLIEVFEDNTKIRRNPEMPLPEGNAETKSVYLKGFNKTETKLQLIDHFKKYEGMDKVIMRYYKEKLLLPPERKSETEANKEDGEETKPKITTDKIVWVKKFKGSIFIVFKTEEQAKAALADITTYGGHPLMKLMQTDYVATKKKSLLSHFHLKQYRYRV